MGRLTAVGVFLTNRSEVVLIVVLSHDAYRRVLRCARCGAFEMSVDTLSPPLLI